MKTIDVNGIRMAYGDTGSGQPLLLVHAFPLSGAMWEPQVRDLSRRFRLITPDIRGFGASELGDKATSMDVYADDLAALLDHLGLDRVAVAGLSMGGYISFALLRRHRARVSALILADTRAQADTPEGKQGREQSARLAEEQGPAAIAGQMLPKLLSSSASDDVRAQVRGIIEANKPSGIAAAQRAMAARPDSTPLLAQIDVPTLVIVGSEDGLTPPNDARAMHSAIPNSRLVEIPGAGHLSNREAPQAFNAAVAALLDDLPKPTSGGAFKTMSSPEPERGKGGGSGGTW